MVRGKGINPLLAAVFYTVIVLTGVSIVLTVGLPALEKARTVSSIEQARVAMSDLDALIREVASEGRGSQRVVTFRVTAGSFRIAPGKAEWTIQAPPGILDPRSWRKIGNLILGSDTEVDVYEERVDGADYFVMENEILRIYIQKLGSGSSINTSKLIYRIENKDLGVNETEPIIIIPDDDWDAATGTGYTSASMLEYGLGTGQVSAYVNSNAGINYRLDFILESGADFLTIKSSLT